MKLSGASVVVFCRSRFEKETGEVVVALKNVTGANDAGGVDEPKFSCLKLV